MFNLIHILALTILEYKILSKGQLNYFFRGSTMFVHYIPSLCL